MIAEEIERVKLKAEDLSAPADLKKEIARLKKEKRAVLLAHYYVHESIQEIADYVGDSLALAQASLKTDADVIVFCGVHFMAETAKILNPKAKVLLPDLNAGCSLADSAPTEPFRAFIAQHPNAVVISYINCSSEIKALSDYICTSANAVRIVSSIPKDKEIIFAPDENLGKFIERATGRKMILWQGACIVHVDISLDKLMLLMKEHPDAQLIAHPECVSAVLEKAHFIGSTTALLEYVKTSHHTEFIIGTEAGILYKMREAVPEKKLIAAPSLETNACACSECPYMKLNTLEKVYHTLRDEAPEINVPEDTRTKALRALNNMLNVK